MKAIWRLPIAAVVVAVMLPHVAPMHAHTLAGTMVSVGVARSNAVAITIAAEADPLIAKLEALAGVENSEPPITRTERRARLESLFPTLRAHIDARLDGTPLRVELEEAPVDDTAHVEMRLTASLPTASKRPTDGRRAFTWGCTFIFGAYQLTSGSSDSEQVEWLRGPQTSTPIALALSNENAEGPAGSRASEFRAFHIRVGHGLAMGALVIWVLRRRMTHRAAGG